MQNSTIYWIARLMRITLIQATIAMTLCGVGLARDNFGQNILDKEVTIQQRNEPLKNILSDIEKQVDVKFAYSESFVDLSDKISIDVRDKRLGELLNEILGPRGIEFTVQTEFIVLSPKKTKQGPKIDDEVTGLPGPVYLLAIEVSGVVKEPSGSPLPGVNVLIKGTSQGTSTDAEGRYTITVEDDAILIFTYIGYKTQEIPVNGRTVIDISLEEDQVSLDEIVVVGYGTQKKKDVTSSISTIESKSVENVFSASFTQALQGLAPGLHMSSSSGAPNAGVRMLIRGVGSINTAAEPLILVDGMPVASGGTSPLDFLNPRDIERVTVLKDAAATSIYGSRGANGVILVTTKSGKNEKGGFSFNYERGLNMPINQVELVNANQWRELVDLGRDNSGLSAVRFEKERDLKDPRQQQRYLDLDLYNASTTDWADLYTRNGLIDKYSFTASDFGTRTNFYISAQYRKQLGNIINEEFKTFTGRINFEYKPNDILGIGIRYTYANQNNEERETGFSGVSYLDRYVNNGANPKYATLYTKALPIFPETWPDNGDPFDPLSGNNLTYSASRKNFQYDNRINSNLGTAYLDLTPLKGLTVHGEFGINYRSHRSDIFVSGNLRNEELETADLSNPQRELLDYIWEEGVPYFQYREQRSLSWNSNFRADYDFTLWNNHHVNFLVGMEALEDDSEIFLVTIEDGASPQDPDELRANIRSDDQFMELNHYLGGGSRFFSYFSRLNYGFKDKYLFQGTLRRDGSSKFTPEDRFYWFPSASAAWIMTEESFFPKPDFVNRLKLRGSYGLTGNANIASFLYLDSFVTWPNYPNRENAYTQDKIGSKTIQWEKSITSDVALEFVLWNNRISGSVGYYNTTTSDLLMNFPTAASIGIYATNNINVTSLANVGKINNRGFEFEISSLNYDGVIKWNTHLNFTTNKNKVVELYPGFDGNPAQLSFGGITTVQIGEPMGTYYLPTFGGYDEYGNPLIKEVDQGLADEQVYKYTGNLIRPIGAATNNNRVVQRGKTGLPKWYGGITNTVSYKGISLSVLLTFQGGHYLYDNVSSLRRIGIGQQTYRKDLMANSWSSSNQDSEYPVVNWADKEIAPINPSAPAQVLSDRSTHYLKKGDFLRLRTISIGYDFPTRIAKRAFMKGLNVYLNLNNVATLSGYNSYDPEVVNATGNIQARNIGQGVIDSVPYFQVFSMNLGINLTF